MLTMFFWLIPQSQAVCVASATINDLLDAMLSAETATAHQDEIALHAAAEQSRRLLNCLGDPLGPSMAATYHRIVGFDILINGKDEIGAARSFLAARLIEPSYHLPEDDFPTGSKVADVFMQLPASHTERMTVPQPANEHLLFDGIDTLERPVGLPTILQRQDNQGMVLNTSYLEPDDAMPYYAVGSTINTTPAPDQAVVTPPTHSRIKPIVAYSSSILLVGGAALSGYLIYDCFHNNYDACSDPTSSYRTSYNGPGQVIGFSLIGVGVAGVGFSFLLSDSGLPFTTYQRSF